jgi:hypothetical protein
MKAVLAVCPPALRARRRLQDEALAGAELSAWTTTPAGGGAMQSAR